MSHFSVMYFFLMKLTSQIREMWIGIICIIEQKRILDGWKLCYFNIRGPSIVGVANFLQTVLPQVMEDMPLHVRMNMWMQHDGAPPHYALCSRQVMKGILGFHQITRNGGSTYHAWRHERKNTPSIYRHYTTNFGWSWTVFSSAN